MGRGLFAGEDIIVPEHGYVPLFSYFGPYYLFIEWHRLSKAIPQMKIWGLKINFFEVGVKKLKPQRLTYCDRDPDIYGNVVGFINSTFNEPMDPNVKWEENHDGYPGLHPTIHDFVLTIAVKTIHAGEELFAYYLFAK